MCAKPSSSNVVAASDARCVTLIRGACMGSGLVCVGARGILLFLKLWRGAFSLRCVDYDSLSFALQSCSLSLQTSQFSLVVDKHGTIALTLRCGLVV